MSCDLQHAGLCDVIGHATSSKMLKTRALLCLANQNFSSAQIAGHVITIVSVVTKVLSTQQQLGLSIDTEALNLLIRLVP